MEINKLFDYIYLAEASYANFTGVERDKEKSAEQIYNSKKDGGREKPKQFAELVTENYDVIAHYTDRDKGYDDFDDIENPESGFSATLFKGKANGTNPNQFVLAFKGTDGFKDLVSVDLGDIVADGAASPQIIELYNFMQQIKHANTKDENGNLATYQAAYLNPDNKYNKMYANKKNGYASHFFEKDLVDIKNMAIEDGYYIDGENIYKIDFKESSLLYKDERQFVLSLPDVDNPQNIQVTAVGHSLGGHLAAVFSRLFPEHTTDTIMVNGAGTGDSLAIVTARFTHVSAKMNVDNLLNGLAGKTTYFNEDKIVNITGDKNINLVANDWWFALDQPGSQPEIFIESRLKEVFGHGVVPITNTMAVVDLFMHIDKRLQLETPELLLNKLNPVLESLSLENDETLEYAVNAINGFYSYNQNNIVSLNDRGEFFAKIKKLRFEIQDRTDTFLISDKQDLFELARDNNDTYGMAARYALKYSLSFSIVGKDLAYDKNTREFEKFNIAKNPYGMTDEYINDRIDFMNNLFFLNTSVPLSIVPELTVVPGTNYYHVVPSLFFYHDIDKNIAFGGTLPLIHVVPRYIFGSDKDENSGELTGGLSNDHIYGGGGNDILDGKSGHDYLEGGVGFDAYIIEGQDRVMDADGAGKLIFGSLTGNTPNAFVLVDAVAGIWRSIGVDKAFDGLFTAYREAADLIVKENASGHLARILGYFERITDTTADFLGLRLFDGFEAAGGSAPLQVFNGNDNFHNVISVGKESYAIYSGAKNDIVFGQAATLGADGFALKAQLGTGDDVAYGSLARDRIEGGNGIDLINGSVFIAVKSDKRSQADRALDSDVLVGNEGSDFINGFAGDDVIHAGNVGDHELKEAFDAQGDFVTGGDGNDSIYGSAAKDVLQGGEGSDVVHGGANDDLILGDSFIRMSPNFQRITFDGSPTTYEHRVDLVTGQWKSTSYAASNRLPPEEAKWSWEISADGKDYVLKRAKGGFNNNEHIVENGDDDYLYGGSGNDFMVGQTGNDVLHGQDGDDTIFGDDTRIELSGDDHLIGGKGNDTLIGGKGQDSYYFNQEDLVAADGRSFVDTLIDDGKENYTGKADVIYLDGKAAHEMRWRYDEQKQLWLNDNNSWRIRQIGESLVIRYGQDGGAIEVKDYAVGDYGLDLTLPKAEEDNSPPPSEPTSPNHPTQDAPRPTPKTDHPPAFVQTGGDGDDLLLTGSNSIEDGSLFQEDWGSMSVEYSEEAVLLDGGAGNDYLSTGKGNDRLYGGEGKDRLFAYGGDDELQGGSGDDLLAGGDDSDKLFGEAGNDRLVGQAGDDFLDGGDGADILAGGSGKDWLYGGMGEDVYLYRQQDGQDYLHDSGGEDTLFLPDITADLFNGHIQRQGDDLLLSLDAENQLGIKGFFHAEYAIEHIAFADGSHIHAAALYQQFNQAYQGSQAVYDHSRTLGVYQPVAELL